ncbi:LysR family transcriptional regulator [Salidesulfovibrio onnuriiensis]|uniref:LysR family transcriptional regulator n=1 Tax=Salidesulfovibrio onnuriiensis TaxID=2583823 RepID=UPI0011C85236|nr:LysR substrate-binding domain-containing protein [Salidesulfovibrio onnuriiensis]
MELRQLRYFIAVAEEKHFGRAADRLHMAQPPLSQQIKKLEEDLGVMLFNRTKRSVKLTREGLQFLTVARNTLDTLNSGTEQIRMMARGEIGKLRIGFINSASQSNFPDAVAEFRKKHPSITLDIQDIHSDKSLALLRVDELDACIVQGGTADFRDLEWMTFMLDPYVLALREDHKLAKCSHVGFAALHSETLIMPPRECYPETWTAIMHMFEERGATPSIVQEADTHQTRLALVAAGMGVSFVPLRMEQSCPRSVKMMPFRWPQDPPMSELRLVWRRGDDSLALSLFIEVMKRFAHSEGSCGL